MVTNMDENLYMLWFSLCNKVSNREKFVLIKSFGTATNLFNATRDDFKNKGFYNVTAINNILASKNINNVLSYKSMLDSKNIKIVNINEETYPSLLKHIFDPPILLYYKGRLPRNDETLVSVVGTRTPSPYGENVTYKICSKLAREKIGVVSGLAYGIDTIANKVTVEHNGYTIAVLGSGIDVCYPSSNINLMNKIAENGLVISEYGLGVKPYGSNFPKRNRIIAGLSCATIVTEAPLKSGALITAELALSEGRDVLTLPADVFRRKCEGNNALIKDGAYPILNFNDILLAINYKKEDVDISKINDEEIKEEQNSSLTEEEKHLLKFFTYDGVTIDFLSSKSNFDVSKVTALLTMLEFKNVIVKLPSQKFIKK